MAERLVRIGRVSSVNYGTGMASVTYPDLDDSTTDEFPVFSMGGEYRMPGIGQEVLVLHLSNGQSAGIVMGQYWNKNNAPPASGDGVFHKELGKASGEAYIHCENGSITFHDQQGEFTVGSILERLHGLDGK